MQLRRRPATLVAALVLGATALTSCSATGRDAATNRDTPIVNGANHRTGTVKVLNAFVVSAAGSDTGTFIATFVNNSTEADDTVTAVGGDVKAAKFEPVDIPVQGLTNLATDDRGIHVTGSFDAGNRVTVAIDLGSGTTVTMAVPVVDDEGEYDGLDTTPPAA